MMQEDMFRDYASLNSKTSVLLLDRGTLDQKVFTSSEDIWKASMKHNATSEEELQNRYLKLASNILKTSLKHPGNIFKTSLKHL